MLEEFTMISPESRVAVAPQEAAEDLAVLARRN